MSAEIRIPRYRSPQGGKIELNLPRTLDGFIAVHHSGQGPGLLLLAQGGLLTDGIKARAILFAEEGYSVLAIAETLTPNEIYAASQHLKDLPATDSGLVAVGYQKSGNPLFDETVANIFSAIVTFDTSEILERSELLEKVPCPFVCHFGISGQEKVARRIGKAQQELKRKDGSRIFMWEEGAPGFSEPDNDNFESRADDLAHTRTLELIRRVVGPYYDFVSLFAEHVYHEFTSKDVDATMATMIEEPYVNHVPTLAGGVGHDMLKRFYKYHFVDQNGGGRDRTRISYTMGPNRVVLETYTKFCHDSVIDRYFPGIEPTYKNVEIATVIIVKFRGDKVCHEHLYWDQGSALKQIGVLDAGNLPLAGPEAARKVLDENMPSNIYMQDAWRTSEGKPL